MQYFRSSTNLSIVRVAHILCVLDATNTLAGHWLQGSGIDAPRKEHENFEVTTQHLWREERTSRLYRSAASTPLRRTIHFFLYHHPKARLQAW
jgi:hypothetical protein